MRTAISEGLSGLRLGRFNRRFNPLQIVAVRHPLRVPVIRLEALQHIVGVAQLRRPVQRDQVVVVKHNQLAQPQRSGQRAASCETPSIKSPSPHSTYVW